MPLCEPNLNLQRKKSLGGIGYLDNNTNAMVLSRKGWQLYIVGLSFFCLHIKTLAYLSQTSKGIKMNTDTPPATMGTTEKPNNRHSNVIAAIVRATNPKIPFTSLVVIFSSS